MVSFPCHALLNNFETLPPHMNKLLLRLLFCVYFTRGNAQDFLKTFDHKTTKFETIIGTYKGTYKCENCVTQEVTLILKGKNKADGLYTIINNYELKSKDSTQTAKGRWALCNKKMKRDTLSFIIMTRKDAPGSTTVYGLKKDGNLLPLKDNLESIDTPFDLTLKKQ
jgi:hypothetical protein